MTAWEGSAEYNLPGFESGNPITFRLWDIATNTEQPLDSEYEQGNGTFGNDLYSVVSFQDATGIDNVADAALNYKLAQNFPNPFQPTTQINFSIPKPSHVELTVYNAVGQKVKTLMSHQADAGHHHQSWSGVNDNGDAVSSGVYFYQLKTERSIISKQMVFLGQ